MAQDPLRAVALFGTKLGFLAAQYEIPQVESMRFESRFSRLLRLPLPGMALLLGLAAFGAVLALGRNDRAGVEVGRRTRDLLLGLAFSAALICLFFVTARFRLALVPSLAVLASGALSAWPVASPTRRIVALALGGLAVVCSLLGARGIDAATSDGQFLFRLGVIAEKEQDLGLARERYAAAIAIDPNEAKARINLGTLLAREGRLEEARPLLERGVALDPLSSLGRISLGQLELVTGRPAEAVRWYGEAAALDPESPLAREGLVFANYDRGQVARDDLEALLRLAPQGSPIAQRARNLAYLLESRAPLASAAWLGSAPLRAADLLFVRGRLEQARAAYTSLGDDPVAGEAARLALARLAR
ncbi:MAG: tetratricopeptide repeat protein [Candidatus Eisenbacteria bacterium]|nr:tetratricopeptide repeat protein [Candidatus Eisenbacteria bacterium]